MIERSRRVLTDRHGVTWIVGVEPPRAADIADTVPRWASNLIGVRAADTTGGRRHPDARTG
jgi:hypothetical protein